MNPMTKEQVEMHLDEGTAKFIGTALARTALDALARAEKAETDAKFWENRENEAVKRAEADRDRLAAQLAEALAQVAGLVDALEACVASLERADTKEGVCCCGDSMDRHPDPMSCGHSPVDMGDYYAGKALEAARAALASDQWKGPGEKPHEYSPDPMLMGDCRICGHTREAHE